MQRVLAALLLLCAPAFAAVTWDNNAVGSQPGTTNQASIAITVTGVSSGGIIMVAGQWTAASGCQSGVTATLTDGSTGSVTRLQSPGNSNNCKTGFTIWSITGCASGSHLLTLSFSPNANFPGILAESFSSIDSVTPTENSAAVNTTTASGTTWTVPSTGSTINVNGSMMYAAAQAASGTLSAGAGYTLGAAAGNNLKSEHKAENAGTDTATIGISGTTSGVFMSVVIRPSTGAVTKVCTITLLGAGPC